MVNRRDKKRQYVDLVRAIREIIAEADPLGLLGQGAPKDEYEDEVCRIVLLVGRKLPIEELAREVKRVFEVAFDELGRNDTVWLQIATQISRLEVKKSSHL